MNREELFETINDIDDTYIAEAATRRHGIIRPAKGTVRPARRTVGIAACAALGCAAVLVFTAVGAHLADRSRRRIELSDASKNVTAYYVKLTEGQMISSAGCLAPMTETEIFHKYNTAVFRGTVASIRNILLNYNGLEDYRAIAEIRVTQVYRGDCRPGDTLTVLLPCPIMEGYRVSGCGVAEAVRTGMEGIFMPVRYDDSYICTMNGATLQYNDIADYGFLDGSRWAFLSTETGLLFDSYSFESLGNAETLDDIELYIEKMLRP